MASKWTWYVVVKVILIVMHFSSFNVDIVNRGCTMKNDFALFCKILGKSFVDWNEEALVITPVCKLQYCSGSM